MSLDDLSLEELEKLKHDKEMSEQDIPKISTSDLPENEKPALDDLSLEELQNLKAQKLSSDTSSAPSSEQSLLPDIPTLGRTFAKGATAGLSEPVTAGLSALVEKPFQMAGQLPPRTLDEAYNDYRQQQRQSLQKMEEQNPGSAFGGELAGLAAPGGVYERLFGGATKGTELLKPAIEKIPSKLGQKLATSAFKGAASNAGYGALNPEDKIGAPVNALIGGVAGPIAEVGIPEVAKKGSELLRKSIATGVLPARIQGLLERIPILGGAVKGGREAEEKIGQKAFEQSEEGRKLAYDNAKEDSKEALKQLPETDPRVAGQNLTNEVQNATLKESQAYSDNMKPLIQKYGKETISPENLRKDIVNILKDKGFVDEKGNIIKSAIGNITAPEERQFVQTAVKTLNNLRNNPTFIGLNQEVQSLQSLANFGKMGPRTAQEKLFGKLSNTASNDLINGLKEVSSPEEAKALSQAKARFSDVKPTLDELNYTKNQYPMDVVRTAKGRLKTDLLNETAQKIPELKQHLGDVLLNNITSDFTTPQALTKKIDYFGRDAIKNIIGPEKFEALEEAENALNESHKPFVKGEPAEKQLGKVYRSLYKIAQPRNTNIMKRIGPLVAPAISSQGEIE